VFEKKTTKMAKCVAGSFGVLVTNGAAKKGGPPTWGKKVREKKFWKSRSSKNGHRGERTGLLIQIMTGRVGERGTGRSCNGWGKKNGSFRPTIRNAGMIEGKKIGGQQRLGTKAFHTGLPMIVGGKPRPLKKKVGKTRGGVVKGIRVKRIEVKMRQVTGERTDPTTFVTHICGSLDKEREEKPRRGSDQLRGVGGGTWTRTLVVGLGKKK